MNRTALMRRTPLARGTSKLGRRTEPRRVVHPFPLPTPGEVVTLADIETELHAFGPQAELCRHTTCAACFYVAWVRSGGRGQPNWALLATHPERVSDPHHEPHRGTKGTSLDRDTMPLCRRHHTDGVGYLVRHRIRSDARDSAAFYSLLPFDWRAVVAEMRRRVALTKTKSETP